MMKKNVKKLMEYLDKRIPELKRLGPFNLYDEVDIQLSTELDTLIQVKSILEEGS